MSLFASLGQGDIWALSGISFASPINDLLDKGEFTLEDLLEEDELIQEVKAKNDRLVEFICKESSVDRLLDFITRPALPVESLERVFKFPYMSCEVICCEIPEILAILVEYSEGKYLKKLFSFLTERSDQKLDYYLAGYFEKILEMLFRRMTIPMMKFFNDGGCPLLSKFLAHMDNYSIMQIVQRLMLPHIPFSNMNEGDSFELDENKELYQCNWSYQAETCQLLFDQMFLQGDADVPLHISDLLITVLQLSPPETFVIQFLCERRCIQKLLESAVSSNSDMPTAGEMFSSEASISLAAISVLESLNSRLFESSMPFDQNMSSDTDTQQDQLVHVKEKIQSICHQLVPFLPQVNDSLRSFIVSNPCLPFLGQSKARAERLGHRGLQMVKLIESIVRLCNEEVDAALVESGIFVTCIELVFKFANNSLLHLSVQRIIISILESEESRSSTQRYLLNEGRLLQTVISKLTYYHDRDGLSEEELSRLACRTEIECPVRPQHSSISGNIVLIAQALSIALEKRLENPQEDEAVLLQDAEETDEVLIASGVRDAASAGEAVASPTSAPDIDDSTSLSDSAAVSSSGNASASAVTESGSTAAASNAEGETCCTKADPSNADELEEAAASDDACPGMNSQELSTEKPANLRHLVTSSVLLEWDNFVDCTLRSVLDHQVVGSYQAANLSVFSSSQDDAIKLGVDLDLFQLDASGRVGLDGVEDEDDDDDMEISTSDAPWAQHQYQHHSRTRTDDDDGNPDALGSSEAFDPFGTASISPFDGNDGAFETASISPFDGNGGAFECNTVEHQVGNFADFSAFENLPAAPSKSVPGGTEGSLNGENIAGASAFDDSADPFADFASCDASSSQHNLQANFAGLSISDTAESEIHGAHDDV